MSACEWFVGVGDEAKSGVENTKKKIVFVKVHYCVIPHGFCGD